MCINYPSSSFSIKKMKIWAGGCQVNRLGRRKESRKEQRRLENSCTNSRPHFVLPLCWTSQGSPVEQNHELQGLTKIFLKGYKAQCLLKRELKIFCAHKIMALRVHFLQLDSFQYILGKINSYNGCNLEREILQIWEYSKCHFLKPTIWYWVLNKDALIPCCSEFFFPLFL